MQFPALAEAINALDAPGSCAALRELLALADLLEAKTAPVIDAVARSGEWEIDGAVSPVAWLRINGRMAGGAAKTLTTVAARTAELDVTRTAWEEGRLSAGQVQAIVANVPERHAPLFAEHEAGIVAHLEVLTVAEVAVAMAEWKARADALKGGDDEPDHDSELSFSRTFQGRGEMRGSFDPDATQVIDAALALAQTRDAETEHRSAKVRRADALIEVCRHYLDNQKTKTAGRHRPHLNLVIDLDDAHAGLPGRYIDGSVASHAAIEAILCDGCVHRVVTDGRSAILDYGRSVRTAPPDLFNALALRDGHCREPGCDRPPAWCDAHHVAMWDDGGNTDIANMVLRCTRHHHLLHKRRKLGWTERLESDGTLIVVSPYGRRYVSYPAGPVAQRQLLVS